MDDNSLLVIILAFMLGCMCSGMMKQMCGQRLVEGDFGDLVDEAETKIKYLPDIPKGLYESTNLSDFGESH